MYISRYEQRKRGGQRKSHSGHAGKMGGLGHAGIESSRRACWEGFQDFYLHQWVGRSPLGAGPRYSGVRHQASLIKSSLLENIPVRRGDPRANPSCRRSLSLRFGNSSPSPSPSPSSRAWELRSVEVISPSVTIRYGFFRDYFTFQ